MYTYMLTIYMWCIYIIHSPVNVTEYFLCTEMKYSIVYTEMYTNNNTCLNKNMRYKAWRYTKEICVVIGRWGVVDTGA